MSTSEHTFVAPSETPAPPTASRIKSSALGLYQPGLDGMRGLALLVVLGYHAEIAWTRGAFLAISQFFTLSGFLIMGVLLRNHVGPGRGLRSFWIRRARRLLPAAFLTLAGVALFGATVATRQQATALTGDIFSAATWTANWHFILSGQSYFALFSSPSPVQHFWTLAIEEQFYIILPIGLILLVRKTQSAAILGAVLGGIAVLSTVWMIVLYQSGASLDRLYYGTDTRVAELLAGAVLAVVVSRTGFDWTERNRWILAWAGLIAFAATIWCWVNIPLADGPIWRGGYLVFAVLSCTVILGVLSQRGPLGAFLSLEPLPWIGRLSYGLYLFHWPVYLWLSPERTGLDQWPLLVVRLAVTFSLAILSYRYIEQPILHGRSFGIRGPAARYAVIPLTIFVLISATYITVNRSGDDPLATLRASAASLTMPQEAGDGVLDLLVIPKQADDPVITRLQRDVADDSSVKLTMAPPFTCSGGLVETGAKRTCANWVSSWPTLIKRTNPDVVLFYVDGWAGDDLARLSGAAPSAQIQTATEVLSVGMGMLTAKGAPVVWAQPGTSFGAASLRAVQPFGRAMASLRAQRSDLFEVIGTRIPDPATVSSGEYLSRSSKAILADVSLYQRKTGSDLPRVMIVGDSQSLSLGYGLDRWASVNNRAVVWNHGVEGCGVAVEGEPRSFGASDSGAQRCRDAVAAWPSQLRGFKPDAVIVLSSLFDLEDRRFSESSPLLSFGNKTFDAKLVKQYEQVVDTLSSTGAHVVWMNPPCSAVKGAFAKATSGDEEKLASLNSKIIPQVVKARADRVVTYDLDGVLCPNGKALTKVGGRELRPDGLHFGVDGALWFAERYGDQVLKAAGLDSSRRTP